MKKILSVILVLSMVLALGVTAFAAELNADCVIEEGKSEAFSAEIGAATKITVTDTNGVLTFGELVIDGGYVYVNVTAPVGTAGKVTKIEVKDVSGKEPVVIASLFVEVAAPEEPAAPEADKVVKYEEVNGRWDSETNIYYVTMPAGVDGISAEAYNGIKAANYEQIVFIDYEGLYTWTLTRGDYTKMNVTASIYFGVKVDDNLWTLNANKEVVKDTAAENAVLKALGNTKADVFYVTISDNVNIANVASKPELVVTVDGNWINFNNKFAVTAYKFDGEAVTKVADSLAVKPSTRKLALNLTAAGTYVFIADNHTVAPTTPSTQKPNTETGANSAAAAVVAIAVMAVAAVASKKIVK